MIGGLTPLPVAPQLLFAKGIGGLLIAGALFGAVKYHASSNFDKGVASKAVYIADLEDKLGKALSENKRIAALLESCKTDRDKAQGEVTAHLKQNQEAAKLASETLLRSQENNARALAAATSNNNSDKDFYAGLKAQLEGLTDGCDADGNTVVSGGADLLRNVRNRKR